LDANTGLLRVREGAVIDHETAAEVTIRVRATDNASSPLSSEVNFTVRITDVNESPAIGNVRLELLENPQKGFIIGAIAANDPDTGIGALAGFRVLGANQGQAFALNPTTGELSVNNPAVFNYEIYKSLSI